MSCKSSDSLTHTARRTGVEERRRDHEYVCHHEPTLYGSSGWTISAHVLDPEIWDGMKLFFAHPEKIRTWAKRTVASTTWTDRAKAMDIEIKRLERKLRMKKDRIEEIREKYYDGDGHCVNRAAMREEQTEVEEEIALLTTSKLELAAEQGMMRLNAEVEEADLALMDILANRVEAYARAMDELSYPEKRRLLRMLQVKVVVWPKGRPHDEHGRWLMRSNRTGQLLTEKGLAVNR